MAIPSWVGAIECQPKGGDSLQLGSKGRYGSCAGVKLCDPLVTRGSYLNALEIKGSHIKRYINSSVYFYFALHETVLFSVA